MFNLNWSLLRHALYTYRKGSASKASEVLNVTHATVIRSLKRLEEEAGVQLFHKSSSGYTPTDNGKKLIETAEKIETLIYQWKRDIDFVQQSPSGLLQITTTEAIMDYMICPHLESFYTQFPDIKINFTTSNGFQNITHHEFDIALRSTTSPPEHLVGRKVTPLPWAIYQSKLHDVGQQWIGFTDTSLLPVQWMNELYPEANFHLKASSIVSLVAAARAGLGSAMLPCFVATSFDDLEITQRLDAKYATELWMLYHQESRNCPKVQAFVKWFYAIQLSNA